MDHFSVDVSHTELVAGRLRIVQHYGRSPRISTLWYIPRERHPLPLLIPAEIMALRVARVLTSKALPLPARENIGGLSIRERG